MFEKLIKLLEKIDNQYETSTCEELSVRHISGYLNRLFVIKADKVDRIENLDGDFIESFDFGQSALDELNLELDSNLKALQLMQFKKSDVAEIFKRLYLKKFDNVIKIPNKEKGKSEEYKAAQSVNNSTRNILFPLWWGQEITETLSCIPIEIVNQLFTSNIVSLVKPSTQDALDDQKSYFISFSTQEESKIQDELKIFARKTTIPIKALSLSYEFISGDYATTFGIWLYSKNVGLFLYAVSNLINQFNKILSSSILPKKIQPGIFLNIIADYCNFNHKIAKQEISCYLSFSDLFKTNLKNAFNDPAGLKLEENNKVNTLSICNYSPI